MKTPAVAGLFLTAGLSGCVFVIEDDYEPDPQPQYYGGWDEDEVRYVIYREYYNCDPHEVAVLRHYRVYYGYDDCDIWFLLFLARRSDVTFEVVARRYELCGRRMHAVVRDFGCQPDIFFVYVRDVDRCPPPYGRAYGYWYRRQLHEVELTNEEYRALVDLRIAHDYYGYAPEDFFARCGKDRPCRVLFKDYRNCGRGGKDARMRACVKRERPWEMSRAERERWKRECKAREAEEHARFKREHRDKVEAYERKRGHDERGEDDDTQRHEDRSRHEDREDRGRREDRSTYEDRGKEDDRGRSDTKSPPRHDPPKNPPKHEEPKQPPKNEPPKKEEKKEPPEQDEKKGKGKNK